MNKTKPGAGLQIMGPALIRPSHLRLLGTPKEPYFGRPSHLRLEDIPKEPYFGTQMFWNSDAATIRSRQRTRRKRKTNEQCGGGRLLLPACLFSAPSALVDTGVLAPVGLVGCMISDFGIEGRGASMKSCG